MRTLKPWFFGIVVISGSFVGCADGEDGVPGPAGTDALVAITAEPAGSNCPMGGSRLQFGLDDNNNQKLDATEIDGTQYTCNGKDAESGTNGANGVSALVTAVPEPAGDNCEHGGQRIDQGLDANADGDLDEDEVVSTNYVCSGADGMDGADGDSTLVAVNEEAAGENCPAGGIAVNHGTDDNQDGILDAAESDDVSYVCNGLDGVAGLDGLVNATAEASGANCATGGVKLDFGLDDDNDGALESSEIDGTRYVCNGAAGAAGATSLINITAEAAGEHCSASGHKIEVGLDTNADNALGATEVLQTQYVCNGEDGEDGADGGNGANARIVVSDVAPGADCEAGGKRIAVGLDADDDGALQDSEIAQREVVCSGVDGEDGADGVASLTALTDEAPGSNCTAGGKRIEVGADTDGSGTLEASEVTETEYVCNGGAGTAGSNGSNGLGSLVDSTAEAAGANCANGGQRLSFGLDDDNDGTLDAGEVDGVRYVCSGSNGASGTNGTNGTNGLNSLVSVVNEAAGANCANGGERISWGVDDDRDTVLDAGEVDGTRYVCDGTSGASGANGTNSLVSVANEVAGANCANGGERITWGVDDDRDTVLDAGEVDGTRYVCDGLNGSSGMNGMNGANGTNGTNGLNSLVNVVNEAAGANCANGGERITYGMDDDRDNVLDAGEIDGTRYVCDGASGTSGTSGTNGLSSLVTVTAEAAGANCANGGQRIQTGLDDNGNGTLAAGEVDATSYVCNGAG